MASDIDAYSRGYVVGLQAAEAIVEELRQQLAAERQMTSDLLETIRRLADKAPA